MNLDDDDIEVLDLEKEYTKKSDLKSVNSVSNLSFNKKLFEICKKNVKLYANLACCLGYVTVGASNVVSKTIMMNFNQKRYEKLLTEYNQSIAQYAEYINSLNLSNFEVIMKVMIDMWSNIEGYKLTTKEKYDKPGIYRLLLYNNGYGVCRNMADDFTARMNAINPEYEVCNIVVFLDAAESNKIQTKALESEHNITGRTNIGLRGRKLFGNHMVSCVKLNDLNELLIVDPTNPSLGIFKDGKIFMLSDKTMNGLHVKTISSIMTGKTSEYVKKYWESYNTNGDFYRMKELYGIESQNKALEKINLHYDTDHYRIK